MSHDSRPEARRPSASKWVELARTQTGVLWERRGVRVLSTLDMAKLPQRDDVGPQWHISVSDNGKHRPSAEMVARALRDFGMEEAEEDNHHPGIARHFWMPVDPAFRVTCECKEDEVTVVEPDGYTWANDADESKCRGCEFARVLGKPCTVHARAEAST